VDNWGIPTGATENWPAMSGELGDKTFDDGFDEVPQGSMFALSGGDRRIEVIFDNGYPAVQIFAPHNDDVIGIEPMTAPTNALRKGGYSTAVPGRPASAKFTIRVS
jgi:galactose mutarotase-like enzyme